MLMKYFFLAYVSGKMAKDMPNDRLNRAKHVPLSDDWQQQFASVAPKRIDLWSQSRGGGRRVGRGGETSYDPLEDLEPFF